MSERLGNLGYLAFIKETTKGTPLTPTTYLPIYDETMATNGNLQSQQPIYGGRFATYATLQGQRDHKGDITTLAEPNTTAHFLNMLLTKGMTINVYTFTITSHSASAGATYTNNGVTFTVVSAISSATTLVCYGTGAPESSGTLTYVSGTPSGDITFSANSVSGPYTHPFTLGDTTKSYTMDISTGNVVKRFWGVEASSLSPDFSDNEMRHKIKASALGSFQARTIATVNTTTITLTTKYDPEPNKGLVVGDLVRIYKAATGATLDTTVSDVNVDGVTVVLGASAADFAAGDIIHLRPATPSFTLLPTFLWSKAQFCFGATAAAALAAAQTRVESGSTFELINNFEDDGGAKRSGSFDPAALIRTTGDGTITIKKFFDTPEEIQRFNDLDKRALVIRFFSGDSNQYEYRVTFNNITTDTPAANISAGNINYATLTYRPIYDTSDAAGMGATVINGLATV